MSYEFYLRTDRIQELPLGEVLKAFLDAGLHIYRNEANYFSVTYTKPASDNSKRWGGDAYVEKQPGGLYLVFHCGNNHSDVIKKITERLKKHGFETSIEEI